MDFHQRIQLTEITTSSLRSGSPLRHQLNFTLLMEKISSSLALSSEFVGNHKNDNSQTVTFLCVFYCLYKSMLQYCGLTICYHFHCSVDLCCANTSSLYNLEWQGNHSLCNLFSFLNLESSSLQMCLGIDFLFETYFIAIPHICYYCCQYSIICMKKVYETLLRTIQLY